MGDLPSRFSDIFESDLGLRGVDRTFSFHLVLPANLDVFCLSLMLEDLKHELES
jgi:hypothetical protein